MCVCVYAYVCTKEKFTKTNPSIGDQARKGADWESTPVVASRASATTTLNAERMASNFALDRNENENGTRALAKASAARVFAIKI